MRRIAAIVALSGFVCTRQAEASRGPQPNCGTDRWPVKVLADSDAAAIDSRVVETTVAALNELPIPEMAYPQARRLPPHELRVYRVRAQVAHIIVEDDRDWHVVLRDSANPTATMIVEIPDPSCVTNQAHAARFSAARDSLRRVPRAAMAAFEGVGFFDFIHNQRGRARNGFDLHPVLRIAR